MNHASFSPGRPNESVGRKVTPSSRSSDATEGSTSGREDNASSSKKQSVSARFLIGEDLQKIRHSSHRNAATIGDMEDDEEGDNDMYDSDHDNVIKDLLYPALEEGSSRSRNMELDFFEEDYHEAQAAMHASGGTATTAPSTVRSSFRSSSTSLNDSFRNSSMRSSLSSIPEPFQQSYQHHNSDASFSAAINSSYLNALRRRGSQNNSFDFTADKHRR